MRPLRLTWLAKAVLAFGLASLPSCRRTPSRPAAKPAPSATAAAKTTLARPRLHPALGGVVTTIADYSVELFVLHSGRVEALVSESERSRLGVGVQLAATMPASDGRERISFTFDAQQERFVGQAKPGVTLESGPATLELVVNDKPGTAELTVLAAADPELGGYVLVAGDCSAEVVPKASGELEALARDARGQILDGAAARLTVRLRGSGASRVEVPLAWDAAVARFEGHAPSPLSFGFLELGVERDGKNAMGRRDEIALQPEPSHGGRLLAVGNYSVEIARHGATLDAHVSNAFGKPYPAPHLKLLAAIGANDHYEVTPLLWNAASSSYRATLPERTPESAPLRLSLTAGARTFVGSAPELRPRAAGTR
jgi:hypothetical protein